ncbi:MAG: sterol desaturase family protein, partial [Bdellovibrionaceae bacterium]|nr:sterol desaturase family protein [Pseudobdellovibrionaceae bacterium]
MPSVFREWLDRFLVPVDDPGSRFFYLNLLVTFLFIFLWIYFSLRKHSVAEVKKYFIRFVFNKKYWWNRSTKLDYKIYFLNSVFKIFLFIPFLDVSFRISTWTVKSLLPLNNYDMMRFPVNGLTMLVFTICAFLFDDFLRFFHHWGMHRVPFLWELHKTHHSARLLTPVTLYRTHPLESAMATIRNSISTGVAVGLFIFFFNSRYSLFTVFSVNVFGFVFNLLGSNLRHSHIPMGFGYLEYIFISPKQHQIHHSTNPKHFNKNYGVSLSFWD